MKRLIIGFLLLIGHTALIFGGLCDDAIREADHMTTAKPNPTNFIIKHNPEFEKYRKLFDSFTWNKGWGGEDTQGIGTLKLMPRAPGEPQVEATIKIGFDAKTTKVNKIRMTLKADWKAGNPDGTAPAIAADRQGYAEIAGLIVNNNVADAGAIGSDLKNNFRSPPGGLYVTPQNALITDNRNMLEIHWGAAEKHDHGYVELSPSEQLGFLNAAMEQLAAAGFVPAK